MGGSNGVEVSALRSNGSSNVRCSVPSIGETGMLWLALIDIAGVGGISIWSKFAKHELAIDEERLDGGLAKLVVWIPKPAGTAEFLRLVNLRVKEFRRIDRLLKAVSVDCWRLSVRRGAISLEKRGPCSKLSRYRMVFRSTSSNWSVEG